MALGALGGSTAKLLYPDCAKNGWMLRAIDDEIKQMEEFKAAFEEKEDLELEARMLSLNLPEKETMTNYSGMKRPSRDNSTKLFMN